jgi:hypothetical protein
VDVKPVGLLGKPSRKKTVEPLELLNPDCAAFGTLHLSLGNKQGEKLSCRLFSDLQQSYCLYGEQISRECSRIGSTQGEYLLSIFLRKNQN